MTKPCCGPVRDPNPHQAPTQSAVKGTYPGDVVKIPGGQALIGTKKPLLKIDGEGPQRKTRLAPFQLATTPVTNAAFQEFVAATGYQTDAERFGWSFVFHNQVPVSVGATNAIQGAEWWRRVDGANWHQPFGPKSNAALKLHHPVVQISWNDAQAYCAYVGGRLPSEAEWEHSARGGLGDVTYPWGDQDPDDTDHFPCNIWQGQFPHNNTGADGYHGTAPAQSFAPNDYGLFNMSGNTWDWTADDFSVKSLSKAAKQHAAAMQGHKVIKGGSYLCHHSYCTRYRIAARTGNTPDSATTHMSFRIAFDL